MGNRRLERNESPGHTPGPESIPLKPPNTKQIRILMVDDDPEIRELGVDMLGCNGHKVTAVGSADKGAQEAVNIITGREFTSSFDVVITDLEMPEKSGVDVLRAVAGRKPVIVVSGRTELQHGSPVKVNGEQVTKESLMKLGALDVMQKPFDIERLSAAVRNAVAK
ncbi:MAG: response regulator [Candidatus Altiarchaeota archaeon]|nr:response regulator [Candidatus Altiarchaeota archaeon]